jgi:phage regulator Rha-like protein
VFDSTSLPTVAQDDDGQLTTTSLIVAEGVDVQHKNILGLVRKNLADFEEFGGVAFETRPFETAGGAQLRTMAVLNRDQALLLMTYLRNSAVVRDFKKRLIRAFTEMERRLADGAQPAVPQTYAEALRAAADAAEQLEAEKKRAAELEGPAESWRALASPEGDYSVAETAKILGRGGVDTGRNRLFRQMEQLGWIYREKSGRPHWVPYQSQRENGRLTMKINAPFINDRTGQREQTPPTVRVTLKGIEDLRRLIPKMLGRAT